MARRAPVPTNNNHPQRNPEPHPVPRARAYAGLPCRGRHLVLVVVLTCTWCSGTHSHRLPDTAELYRGKARRKCPVTGWNYRLSPVRRMKPARPARRSTS